MNQSGTRDITMITLKETSRRPNIVQMSDREICALCGKTDRPHNLTGSQQGRESVKIAAEKMSDEYILNAIKDNPEDFKYHSQSATKTIKNPKTCYANYLRRASRYTYTGDNSQQDLITEDDTAVPASRLRKSTRSHSSSSLESIGKKTRKETPCIICNKYACGSWPNETRDLWRISEIKLGKSRASRFLSAAKCNNDAVSRRCALYETIGDIFAADVYYHATCLRTYISNHEKTVKQAEELMKKLLENKERESNELSSLQVSTVLGELDLKNSAYTLTNITKQLNETLHIGVDNRHTKTLLINHFGEEISFSYPKDRSKPQIVYGRSVKVPDIIEGRLRKYDSLKECAILLTKEAKDFGFGLESSLCLPSDLKLSLQHYKDNRPPKWLRFVSLMFSGRKQSDEWLLKFDTAYQFFWHWITGKITPLHCATSEMIHCLTKSKEVIQIMNRLGMVTSYDNMKRIDVDIAQTIIEKAGDHRCPVSDDIKSFEPIQGAIDNFNHKERTNTGGGISNDTVLVIFQNRETESDSSEVIELSKRQIKKAVDRERNLQTTLPCQELLESHLIWKTADIDEGFVPIMNYEHDKGLLEEVESDFFTWWYARNAQHRDEPNYISSMPSFIAVNSKLISAERTPPKITAKSFIPILPYPATKMDSIYTALTNFKDVLAQKGETTGAMWCDEGVYCLAKEIQLLEPDEFGMIFLGLGPFHWSKILMGAIGKWLAPTGIGMALVNANVFTKEVAHSSVLKGGDYMKAKDGLNIIAEAMLYLQFEAFLDSEEFHNNKHTLELEGIQPDLDEVLGLLYHPTEGQEFRNAWEYSKVSLERLRSLFEDFRTSAVHQSNENFQFWNIFLKEMFPTFRDFELSIRKGDWQLYLTGIERSLEIFFGTKKPNYSRYGSAFYQDILDMQRKFPALHRHFQKHFFVCYLSERQGSGIGFDQGLEKVYNFTAKAIGGIIGETRKKKSIAFWDIIKHQKDLFVSFLKDEANIGDTDDELSLHHEFNLKASQEGQQRVRQLVEYIKSINNPFSAIGPTKLLNITTQEEIEDTDYLLDVMTFGRDSYKQFVEERFVTKSSGFHAPISTKYQSSFANIEAMLKEKEKRVKLMSDDAENSNAVNYLQYALTRGKTLQYMLQYPLTSRPIYLLEQNTLNQKKAPKSGLTNILIQSLDKDVIIVNESGFIPHTPSTAVVIDLMSVIRKLSAVELNNVKTFGAFCYVLLNAVLSYCKETEQIHLIMENYQYSSIKSTERIRRAVRAGNTTAGVLCDVVSENQPIPASGFDDFFRRLSNKLSLQNFFLNYCVTHYRGSKPLFVAGGLQKDPDRCSVILGGEIKESKEFRASHEEADDRMMYSINQIYKKAYRNKCRITVVSPDTDIFVVLLYHLKNTWYGLELYLMKKGHIKVTKKDQKELYPLHILVNRLDPDIVDNLPAGHSLTGCDTVAKVGTKNSLLKVLKSDGDLIQEFGSDRLDEDAMVLVERFLVKVIAPKAYSMCQLFDELRLKMYHHSRDKKLIQLPCSSNEIRQNIRRAHLQARMWVESPFGNIMDIVDPEDFGYDSSLSPVLFDPPYRPLDVPEPCSTCKSCVKSTCICRQNNISCSEYCKCGDACKNPFNITLPEQNA